MRLKSVLFPVILTASLILNGAAVGYFYSQLDKDNSTLATKQITTSTTSAHSPGFLSSIPNEKRQHYIATKEAGNAAIKNDLQQVAVMRGQLLELLAADSFSPEAYKKKLDEMIALQNKIQRKRIEPTLQLAESLTTEERKQLVKQLVQQTRQARKPAKEGF